MEKLIAAILFAASVLTGAHAAEAVEPATDKETPPVVDNKALHAEKLLDKVRQALNTLNYEASFILLRGKFAEPYNWMHGVYEGQEIEYMRSQNGPNVEIVRKGSIVAYFEAESQPHAVRGKAIQGVLPVFFFDDSVDLGHTYSVALGGKSRVLDRAAQLIRIDAKDDYRFNYWLWMDSETGLLLKSALVSKQGEVLEQFQLTHLNLLDQAPKLAEKISTTTLPDPIEQQGSKQSRWKINWLPQGFKIASANQHKLSLTGEFTDYILVTDGLVELSVYVQKPLSNNLKGGSLRSGSTTVAVHHGNGFDVSVIGKVPAITAERIAASVSAP